MPTLIWLAAKRLRSRLGLCLLSLLGIAVTTAVAAGVPMFSQAVSFLVLREELADLARAAGRPPCAVRLYFLPSKDRPLPLETAQMVEDILVRIMAARVQLPIREAVTRADSRTFVLQQLGQEQPSLDLAGASRRSLTITVLGHVAEHVVVHDGEAFGSSTRQDRLAVWAPEEMANETGMNVGDVYDLLDELSGQRIPAYVAGIWEARDPRDPYWYENPTDSMGSTLLVSPDAYLAWVQPRQSEGSAFVSWYFVFDEKALSVGRADAMAQGLEAAANMAASRVPGIRMDYSPREPLQRYMRRKAALLVLLVGFSLPGLGLLVYFLSLVSGVTALFLTEETAIMASRGGGRGFIMGLAGLEAGLLVLGGSPLGLALGFVLARLMGYTQSFLSFVSRPPVTASLQGVDWRLLGVALLIALLARLLPAFRAAGESAVGHLRERSRQRRESVLPKAVLDGALALITAYAYWQLSNRGTLGILGWEPSGDPFREPLLLLAPSLFVFTASLLVAHLFPLVVWPLDRLSGWLGWFPQYMGLRQLVRQSKQYASPLFLVVVCLALGGFYSSMALSLDRWLRDRIYYRAGADFAFRQGPAMAVGGRSAGGASGEGIQGELDAEAEGGWLLPVSDYLTIPGVMRAARVGEFAATAAAPSVGAGRFLGIDRLDFPQVAYWRDDFAGASLGELMNRLAGYDDGLLVSRRFLAANSLAEGQPVDVDIKVGAGNERVHFRIVGAFDSFPTMAPEGEEVFVGNLEYLFEEVGGILRHHVWLRTDPTANTNEIVRRLQAMGIEVISPMDARLLIARDEGRVERIGLFGVLSIGFLASSILSCLGLLVYTYASLQGRLQLLSVLRAIGAQTGQVVAMVGTEYVGVMAYGVASGTALGVLASWLFVPFFQFSSEGGRTVPPFLPEIAWIKIAWLAAAFAVSLIVSQLIIIYGATKRDAFQVLRLGQHE